MLIFYQNSYGVLVLINLIDLISSFAQCIYPYSPHLSLLRISLFLDLLYISQKYQTLDNLFVGARIGNT